MVALLILACCVLWTIINAPVLVGRWIDLTRFLKQPAGCFNTITYKRRLKRYTIGFIRSTVFTVLGIVGIVYFFVKTINSLKLIASL